MSRALQILPIALILAAASVLSFRTVYEPDLGWHLAHGRENFAGRLVRTNLFSFNYADYRQHYTSWLFDSGAYGAWALGGDTAVQALQAAFLAATFGLVYAACRLRSPALPAWTILVLGFLIIEPRAIPRPHLISFVGFAALAWLLERAAAVRSAAPLVWAVPLVAIWSNAHAESVLGVAAVALFAAAETVWPSALPRREALKALLISLVTALALLANPYGWGLLRYLWENVSVPQVLGIAELQPAYLPAYRAFFTYAALTGLLFVIYFRRLSLWEFLAAVVFGALGFRYLRLTPLLFLLTAPMLAFRLAALSTRGFDARAQLVTALAAAIFLSRIPLPALVSGFRPGTLHPETMFPRHAMQFVRSHGLSGPTFNSNNLGGWIAWTAYPAVRIFQDSRLQAYPADHFRRILDASRSLDGWATLVRDVDWAMLSTPRPNALSGVGLFRTVEWATVYWDDGTEILVRRDGVFRELARANEYLLLTSDAALSSLALVLSSTDRDRLLSEARRSRAENPDGFMAAAVLCVAESARQACEDVARIARAHSAYRTEADLVRVLRRQQ